MSKFDLLLELDPDFYKGTGEFNFPNGDIYVGEYCAHRSGIVWREGSGKYTTEDGQIYAGEWRDDKLMEGKAVEVTYKDGVQYYGCIAKNKYEGPGTYIFDHKMALLCDFSGNKPVGEITIIDTKGREWHGVAAQEDSLLLPEHIYFNNINNNSGKGRRKHISAKQRKRVSDISFRSRSLLFPGKVKPKSITQLTQRSRSLVFSQSSKILDQPPFKVIAASKQSMSREEAKVFGKTKKTAFDLQLENSDWYKDYVNFKKAFNNIKETIDFGGEESLNAEEKQWYAKYMNFKQRYWEIMNSRKNKDKKISKEEFFEQLRIQEFENKCPPVQVIYATEDCGSVCDCEVVNEEDNISFMKM